MKKTFIAAALLSTTLSAFAANNSMVNNSVEKPAVEVSKAGVRTNGEFISADQLRVYSNSMVCVSYNRYFVEQIGNPNYRKVRDNISRLENAIGRDNIYEMVNVLNDCVNDKALFGYFVEEVGRVN